MVNQGHESSKSAVQQTPIILGIAGGTGSGKTTVARSLIELIGPENIAYLEHDNYYRDLSHLSFEERAQVNFDHPDSFDTEFMIEHIKSLKQGKAVDKPVYSYKNHERTEEVIPVYPHPLIIVEDSSSRKSCLAFADGH